MAPNRREGDFQSQSDREAFGHVEAIGGMEIKETVAAEVDSLGLGMVETDRGGETRPALKPSQEALLLRQADRDDGYVNPGQVEDVRQNTLAIDICLEEPSSISAGRICGDP